MANTGPGTDFPSEGDINVNPGPGGARPDGHSKGFNDFFDFDVNSSQGSGLLNWRNFNPKAEAEWKLTNIGNVGGPGMPTFNHFAFGNTSGINNGFNSIGSQATGGTLQNFNRAANRLRERIDAQGQSQSADATNSFLGRGLGGDGLLAGALGNIRRDSGDAFAQGLVGLESGFEGFRQQGLQTALGAQQGISNLFGLGEELRQKDTESYNSLTNDAFQSERGRQFDKARDQAQITADEKQARLDMLLKQIIEQARLGSGEAIAEATGSGGNSLAMFNGLIDLFGSLGGGE